ncbi:MAG: hypothetical protein WA705_30340 [Candidatus Ozemobacteraceae bacterium]
MDSPDRIFVKRAFPKISDDFAVTSPQSPLYNCVAWAAGDDSRWWEPDAQGNYFWPEGIPRDYSIAAYVAAYKTIGYTEISIDDDFKDCEVVAIFEADGKGTHAARSVGEDFWTSKLGRSFDIKHRLRDLEGKIYGNLRVIMSRPQKLPGV